MNETTSVDIDRMVIELKAEGWVEKLRNVWKSPSGALFIGPAGAWRKMKGLPSVIRARDVANGRQRLIDRGLKLRIEIEQIFTDCASWNDNARKPNEEPVDCDPDGQLRRMADGLDRMIENESRRAGVSQGAAE